MNKYLENALTSDTKESPCRQNGFVNFLQYFYFSAKEIINMHNKNKIRMKLKLTRSLN